MKFGCGEVGKMEEIGKWPDSGVSSDLMLVSDAVV